MHTQHFPTSSIFKSSYKKRARCFISKVTDPWINLAFEEQLLRQKDGSDYSLFLWRNAPSVIIGRNQNPWTECHLSLMAQDGIPLVRRKSGGGAVYHDLGNANYSIIMPRPAFQRATSVSLICQALHQLDIPAKVNERFDIVIHGAKVSGSAYKLINERAYHHGTMLIDSDLKALGKYLRPTKKNIVCRGVPSVRSPVTRLRDYSFTVDYSPFCEEVIKQFRNYHNMEAQEVSFLSMDDFEKNLDMIQFYTEIKSQEWIYGQSPQFEHTIRVGEDMDDLTITVYRGKITSVNYRDHLSHELKDQVLALAQHLIGQWYHDIQKNVCLTKVQVTILNRIKEEISN